MGAAEIMADNMEQAALEWAALQEQLAAEREAKRSSLAAALLEGNKQAPMIGGLFQAADAISPEAAALLTELSPGSGNVLSAYDAAQEAEAAGGESSLFGAMGHAPGAALGILGALPVLGTEAKAGKTLDMAAEAKKAREAVAGFGDKVLYHYTDTPIDFKEFKPSSRGAVYLAEDPDGAMEGAFASRREWAGDHNYDYTYDETRPRIYPVKTNAKILQDIVPQKGDVLTEAEFDALIDKGRAMVASDDPYERAAGQHFLFMVSGGRSTRTDEVARTIQYADDPEAYSWVEVEGKSFPKVLQRLGADAVKIEDEAGKSLAVFNPSKIRSIFAAFDPSKAHSADLLAGIGGTGLLAAALASQEPES